MKSRNNNNNNNSNSHNQQGWSQRRSDNAGHGWSSSSSNRANSNSSSNYRNYQNNNQSHSNHNSRSNQTAYSSSYSYSYSYSSYNKRDSSGTYKHMPEWQPPRPETLPKAKNSKSYYGPVLPNLQETDPKVLQVKNSVDQYLKGISRDNWDDSEWKHKILSQFPHPDFTRTYTVSSIETLSSQALSLQTMGDQLEDYIPKQLLTFDLSWWNKKIAVALETVSFVQTQQEFLVDPENILAFFQFLPYNLIFDAGFHAMGISVMDEKMCYCPCGYKMKAWHHQFHLHFLHKSSRDDYCSDRKFKHIDLMFHLDTVSKLEDVNGLIHRGLHKYLNLLYHDWNGGRGHKALYHVGDKNYKDIEAYEKRTLEKFQQKLLDQLAKEEKMRLDMDRAREALAINLKNRGLEVLNKDKFDQIQDLSKNLQDMSLEMHEKKIKTPEELNAAREDLDSIVAILQSKCRWKRNLAIKSQFRLQQLMDDWYEHPDNDVLHLFQPINNYNDLIKFMSEWDVSFEISLDGMNLTKNRRKDLQAQDNGGPTAQFLSSVWKQLGDLTVKVSDTKSVKLFESTKGGLVVVTEDVFFSNDHEYDNVMGSTIDGERQTRKTQILTKVKLWYRAIGRIIIHSLMGKNDSETQKWFPIPSFVVPRFYRNIIFRDCGPEDNDGYEWAEVVNDLRDLDLGSAIDHFVEEKKDAKEEIFTKLIPENFIKPRKIFIEAFREGITIGGIIDSAGQMMKNIPVAHRKHWMLPAKQLKMLMAMSSRNSESHCMIPYFKNHSLDVLDATIFAKSSVTAEDICSLLRIRLWGFNDQNRMMVSEEIVDDQKRLFKQMKNVLKECSDEDAEFPSRFIEFFTGFAYPPVVEESELSEAFPEPDAMGKKFEITIEFNGEVDPESLPVAHTCAKMMKLPGTAYKGDATVFKRKLLDSLKSMPSGAFGMK